MINKIDWVEAQIKYDSEKISERELCKFYKISTARLHRAKKNGLFKTREKGELKKIIGSKGENRRHTDVSRSKISKGRIKYLLENPDKVPYLLNHSSKESYPEKYFTELFKKENIPVEKSFRIGLYELDFCIPDRKIDIEIDGSQHYYDLKIVESDIRRNVYLENLGWDIIRIKWSDYKKMNFEERSIFIKLLKGYIDNLIIEKPIIKFTKLNKGYDLCDCGNIKCKKSKNCRGCKIKKKDIIVNKKRYDKKSKCEFCEKECSYKKNRCESCFRKQNRKVDRPSYLEITKDLEMGNYSSVGRKYGVSDNTIRKWIKYYEKMIP